MCATSLSIPFFGGHLGCFHVLAIVNSAAVNTEVHVSFRIVVFSGYIPRKGIARYYGNIIFLFYFIGVYLIYNVVLVSGV